MSEDDTKKKKTPTPEITPEAAVKEPSNDVTEDTKEVNSDEETKSSEEVKKETARGHKVFKIVTAIVTVIIIVLAGFGGYVVLKAQKVSRIKEGVKKTLTAHESVTASSELLWKAVEELNVSTITSTDELNTKYANIDTLLKNVEIDEDILKTSSEKLGYDEVKGFRDSISVLQNKTVEYIDNGKKTLEVYRKVPAVNAQIDAVTVAFTNYSRKTGNDLEPFYKELDTIAQNSAAEKQKLESFQVDQYGDDFKKALITALDACHNFAVEFAAALRSNDSIKILSATFTFQKGLEAYTTDIDNAGKKLIERESTLIQDIHNAEMSVKAEYDKMDQQYKVK